MDLTTSSEPSSILITGGRGYLGARVADYLSNSGFQVSVSSRSALSSSQSKLPLVTASLSDTSALRKACRSIDTVIHTAALNENDSLSKPVEALEVNALGSARLLEAAIEEGVRRFIYFSTAHVYGHNLKETVTETTLPRPHHPYASSHLAAEHHLLSTKGVEVVILRISNGVGAPTRADVNRWTLLAMELSREAVTSRRLQLRTSGEQLRDFIPIIDIARACEHFCNIDKSHLGDGIFNLGTAQSLSILAISKQIQQRCKMLFGFEPELVVPKGEEKTSDHSSLNYDNSKLLQTGFRFQSSISEAIDETLRFCYQEFSESP